MAKMTSYEEAIEKLAIGLGIVSGREEKLTVMSSYLGKQKRYQHAGEVTSSGLLQDLVTLLAGSAAPLKDELQAIFSQYENIFSYLRAIPLFTKQPQINATKCFLLFWVYPQIAAFLHCFRNHFPSDSPLPYLIQLLPVREEKDYHPVVALRAALKKKIPADINATEFRTTIDKLNLGSKRKIASISADIRAFKNCFLAADSTRAETIAKEMQALYVAGIAVQRFVEMDRLLTADDGQPLLIYIRHHLQELADPKIKPPHVSLAKCHVYLLKLLTRSVAPDYYESKPMQQVWGHYASVMCLEDRHEEPIIADLEVLFSVSDAINIGLVRQKLEQLTQSDNFSLFQPVGHLYAGKLALIEGELAVAKYSFLQVLAATKEQQLGEIAFEAAGHAIALALIVNKKIPNGSLEPLVSARIENAIQELTIQIGHRTPFCLFDKIVQLDIAKLTIFGAIRDFNAWCNDVGCRQSCNPLARLDAMMARYFAHRDLGSSVQEATNKAFPKLARTRTVLSMHTVSPYEALRDICFYLSQCFHSSILGLILNPALKRYLETINFEKRAILRVLDSIAYASDAFGSPRA